MAEVAEPMRTLLGLILFLAIAAAFYFSFGNPNCDGLANSTASNLQIGINKVTISDFPAWNNQEKEPTDDRYYERALVRLCQQPPTRNEYGELLLNLEQAFYGGVPQYQIYYEQFPQMQSIPLIFSGGIWNEAYPWGGGAGGTVAFWAGMRGLSLAGKAVKAAISAKAFVLGKAVMYSAKVVKGGSDAVGESFKKLSVEKEYGKALQSTETHLKNLVGEDVPASLKFSNVITFKTTQNAIGAFEKEGFLVKSLTDEAGVIMDDSGRLIISNEKVPVKISVIIGDAQGDRVLFVKKDALGRVDKIKLLDETAIAPSGFEKATVVPSEMFGEYKKLAGPDEAKALDSLFVSADDIDPSTGKKFIEFLKAPRKSITESKFFKSYFLPTVNKFEKTVQKFKTAGYDVDKTFMKPEDTKAFGRSLNNFLQEKENYDRFAKPFILSSSRIKAYIKTAFGIASDQQIDRQFTSRYITEVLNKIDGVAFVPRDSKLAIYRQAMEVYPTFSKTEGVREFPTLAEQLLHNMKQDPEYAKLLKDGTIQEASVRSIADNLEKIYKEAPNPPPFDSPEYKEMIYNQYFTYEFRLATDATEAEQKSIGKELNLLTGFMEQNPKATTVTSPRIVAGREVLTSESRKLIYLHGTALINPVSFVQKGLALSELTQGCEYNSICVYSHATQLESPFFLSAESDKYTVRSWRPVNPLYYIGIQAALMHVPPHPTFYLAGPCIGQAKIWKVNSYEGHPTVFISMDKFDSGDSASNYCYADIDLVNAYTAIWDASDAATIATAVFSGGGTVAAKAGSLSSKAAKAASKGAKYAFKESDPITLAQAAAEAAISWPGYPWKALGFDEMRDIVAKQGFKGGN